MSFAEKLFGNEITDISDAISELSGISDNDEEEVKNLIKANKEVRCMYLLFLLSQYPSKSVPGYRIRRENCVTGIHGLPVRGDAGRDSGARRERLDVRKTR